MATIKTFYDLPNTTTPVNANNLNANFNELDHRTKIDASSEADLNNITETGCVYLASNSSALNHPQAGLAGWLITLNYNNGSRIKQIWTRYTSGGGATQTWMRTGTDVGKQTESWGNWYQAIQ